jgi:hypothetical protein
MHDAIAGDDTALDSLIDDESSHPHVPVLCSVPGGGGGGGGGSSAVPPHAPTAHTEHWNRLVEVARRAALRSSVQLLARLVKYELFRRTPVRTKTSL